MAWFETWFDTPYYHILYKDRDFAEAENFITLLINYLNIPKDSKIIDLACGKGRHSVFLNKMGYEVLGLDLSKESISYNKQFENSNLKFEVHDMRNEIFREISAEKADAVFNLFTSFGYFDDENDDRKVFQSISNVLGENGYFVLDFLNAKWVENSLIEEEIITKEGINFTIKKKIENQNIIKDIYFNDAGKDYHFYEKVKLHTLEEISDYAAEFGFEKVQIFGDYQLNDFNLESSPRCINIFKKKIQN
ncbi:MULTISPECIES: bifunctional 2-polyprenyl-6-hydroxyphenol methylase/3-demethylubiquinol 3-O-methyltransferase UbiG [unclassified Kaistella]|uniref:class I SAM-dependent methyltransferase n=1 Tax=unclassified Kaistella TaxID=2762626 RepID=UPI0027337193|nr:MULTISPECIES: class I SAM-dependent methyltransferase [unclassified Kaistella]MDP2454582.1 class I SAM-dependent methyltransferase [Kaistella sp. SH11-4b]MDP2457320.1 class I SAM-dependent methyltransferase [Kaistella sp. SH40-3]MDP2460080.1 class I SAM-dependent methyltransferase [Kaistella sp. SH19-2b]